MNFYIADTHFGHENVIRFDSRPFANVDEMDREMILRWNRRVNSSDTVYILGDFCFRSKESASWYLRQLHGKKHLILGNHDSWWLKDSEAASCLESVQKMLFLSDGGRKLVLCHFPLAEWNGFYKGAWHLYGHIHNRIEGQAFSYMQTLEKALNAGCMFTGYQPVTFPELVEIYKNVDDK